MIPTRAGYGTLAPLLYLGAPAVLFLLGWVRLPIGLPLLALLAIAAWTVFAERPSERRYWLPAAAGAIAVLLIVGFPAGPFAWDWVKHWALIGELANRPWPLVVDLQGEPRFLRYYVGAYLVPALAHHIVPVISLWAPVLLWFGLGYLLVLRQVASLAPSRPAQQWVAVALAISLGGADFFAHYAYRLLYDYPSPLLSMLAVHHEMWALNTQFMPIEYSSIVTAFAWVPHQAIATFLVASLVLAARDERSFPALLLGFGLLSLWSPYGMIGLLPLVLVALWQHRDRLLARPALFAGAAGAAFALLVVAYLAVDLPSGGACFDCFPERLTRIHKFAPFLFFELLPFGLMLGRRLWTDIACRTAFVTLIPLPLLYGETGDLMMRASLGPLFVLALTSIEAVLTDWNAARRRVIHVVALLLCIPGTVSEVVYLRTAGQAHKTFPSWDPMRQVWVSDFARGDRFTITAFFDRCGWKYLPQYFSTREPAVLRPVASRERSLDPQLLDPVSQRPEAHPQ